MRDATIVCTPIRAADPREKLIALFCRGLFFLSGFLRLMRYQLDHCPTRHLKRAALIFVAVDIEPGLVLSSSPVFADVLLALDLHDRAQRQKRRTGYRVVPAANVRS